MQIPATVGKYELLEFLGGGMSHVYKARDTIIGRIVVVKLLTPEACQDADAKARFLQEVKLAGNIQHDNIVSIFDFGEHDGRPFIVMEYLKGEDLRSAIRGGHTGSLMDRIKIALQVAEALEYVNGSGIVHRDIKPENVHIDPNGRVKLMDFGIAKTADLNLTKTGMTMGTPYYMAPEQIAGRPVTQLADVYAFGLLFYELLTGLRAVNGDSMEAVMFQILNQPLDPAPMVNVGVSPQILALVARCVEKSPENRPRGFHEIVEQLRRFLSAPMLDRTQPADSTAHPGPAVAVKAKSYAGIWLALALLVIAIASGAVWWTTRPKPVPPKIPEAPQAIAGMIYIPAGSFLAGEKNLPTSLSAFYIDQTEVSNADFAAYCQANRCSAPEGSPDLPVVGINVAQARDYAAWKGNRLPTALEWERAARGTDGAKYPWGDAGDASLANVAGTSLKPVESYAAYRGAYQMIGNVWEMVESKRTPSAEAIAHFANLNPPASAQEKWIEMRGGSFHFALAPAYEFASIPERLSSVDIGFRCARSAK